MSIIDFLSTKRKFGLDHSIEPVRSNCKGVEVPTIKPYYPDQAGKRDFFVQWFGESGSVFPESQFKFPFPLTTDNFVAMKGSPHLFSVVMFGQVKDWPIETGKDRSRKRVIEKSFGSETWILWLASHRCHCFSHTHKKMVLGVLLLPLMELPKQILQTGVAPKKFLDTSVMDREVRLYNELTTSKKRKKSR